MRDILGFTIGILLCTALAMVPIGALIFGISAAACDNIEQVTGRETRWEIIGGCYVNVDGEWIPQKSWIRNDGN